MRLGNRHRPARQWPVPTGKGVPCSGGGFGAGWWVVHGVAEWCSGVAEPAGWGEFGVAVCDADLPVLGVHPVMVEIAEQDGVAQRGGTTVGPMQNVVDGTPTRRPVTA